MRSFVVMMVELIVLGLVCSSPCLATLLTNGDFESGLLSPWTVAYPTGPDGWGAVPTDVINISSDSGVPQSGSYGVRIVDGGWRNSGGASIGVVGMISQTVDTVAGQSYLLSYWMKMIDDPGGSELGTVAWGAAGCDFVPAVAGDIETGPCSVVPGSYILNGNFGWTQFSFPVTATGPSMAIALAGRSDFSMVAFDGVSLTPTEVPEPATIGLSATALLAGFLLRRRR